MEQAEIPHRTPQTTTDLYWWIVLAHINIESSPIARRSYTSHSWVCFSCSCMWILSSTTGFIRTYSSSTCCASASPCGSVFSGSIVVCGGILACFIVVCDGLWYSGRPRRQAISRRQALFMSGCNNCHPWKPVGAPAPTPNFEAPIDIVETNSASKLQVCMFIVVYKHTVFCFKMGLMVTILPGGSFLCINTERWGWA